MERRKDKTLYKNHGELGSQNYLGKNIENILSKKHLGLPKNCDANITGLKRRKKGYSCVVIELLTPYKYVYYIVNIIQI